MTRNRLNRPAVRTLLPLVSHAGHVFIATAKCSVLVVRHRSE